MQQKAKKASSKIFKSKKNFLWINLNSDGFNHDFYVGGTHGFLNYNDDILEIGLEKETGVTVLHQISLDGDDYPIIDHIEKTNIEVLLQKSNDSKKSIKLKLQIKAPSSKLARVYEAFQRWINQSLHLQAQS